MSLSVTSPPRVGRPACAAVSVAMAVATRPVAHNREQVPDCLTHLFKPRAGTGVELVLQAGTVSTCGVMRDQHQGLRNRHMGEGPWTKEACRLRKLSGEVATGQACSCAGDLAAPATRM